MLARLSLALLLAASPMRAQATPPLSAPPGARLTTLPRRAGDVMGESSVAIDPNDPRHVLVAFQQFKPTEPALAKRGLLRLDVKVAHSTDAGATWTMGTGTSNAAYYVSGDPSVVYDLHGHAFVGFIAFDHVGQTWYWGKGASRNGIFVRRSLDGGATWEPKPTALIEYPAMQDPPFQDKGYLAADIRPESPYAGRLYFGWTRYTLERSEILFARSEDDGLHWSEPMVISTDPGVPRGSSPGATVGFGAAIGRDGTVYAMWQDGQAIVLAISHDGGRIFEPSRRVVSITPPLFPNIADFPGANGMPAIAIDPRSTPGRLVLHWGDHRYGDLDILSAASEDGGRTWSDPVRVNDDPVHDGKDQILSWMSVDPTDGSVYSLFYDRRGDSTNVLPSVTLARSTDGGRHYRNYAWTTARPDPKRAHFGDYLGLAALGGRVYGAWVEDEAKAGSARISARIGGATSRALGAALIRVGAADFRGTSMRDNGTDDSRVGVAMFDPSGIRR